MSDTSLSPRLRHLLIQEDRRTGALILPAPTLVCPREDVSPPPFSPDYFPLQQKLPPTLSLAPIDRRPSHISNLLNNLSVRSRSSSGSVSPRESHLTPTEPMQRLPSTPLSAPIITTERSPFFHRPSVDNANTAGPHRPDIYRRHSAQPYEINPATNRIIYREFDFSPVGSRAPISRTTKACNACRSRKVRCDAGGQAGEMGTCSRCREAGVECVYTGQQKKRGPCPGSARPGTGQRRASQKVGSTGDRSPVYEQRMSFAPLPPIVPSHTALPPLSFPPGQPPSSSGWTSTQPRPLSKPLPSPSIASRPPSSSATSPRTLHRKPSLVSWHPADIPEERTTMFEDQYSVGVMNDVPGETETFHLRPLTGSAFGGDGRSLPPLRMAIDRRSSYYGPRD